MSRLVWAQPASTRNRVKPLRTRKRRSGRRDRAGEPGRARAFVGSMHRHLFEAQVARTRDAAAVELEGEPLTHRELHEWSGSLATGELRRGIHVHDAKACGNAPAQPRSGDHHPHSRVGEQVRQPPARKHQFHAHEHPACLQHGEQDDHQLRTRLPGRRRSARRGRFEIDRDGARWTPVRARCALRWKEPGEDGGRRWPRRRRGRLPRRPVDSVGGVAPGSARDRSKDREPAQHSAEPTRREGD